MIHNLCKLLHNPFKREILLRVYVSRDGINVGVLADEMDRKGLVPSGVSHYLKELESVGVIRRSRAGRYVNYYPDPKNASPDVKLVVEEFVSHNGRLEEEALDAVFGALMNPFRARVIAALSTAGSIPSLEICQKTGHQPRYLKRDLQAAVDANLIWADDSGTACAVYHFVPPKDPFVKRLVSFC